MRTLESGMNTIVLDGDNILSINERELWNLNITLHNDWENAMSCFIDNVLNGIMLEQCQSFEEVIEFAINREIEAADFYNKLQSLVKHESSIKLLKELEGMEIAHADALRKFRKEDMESEYVPPKILNLKIADTMEDINPQSEMNYQEILVLSIKAEQHANELYLKLADETEDPNTKNMFLRLADEEAKHKLHLEQIYDDEFMVEN